MCLGLNWGVVFQNLSLEGDLHAGEWASPWGDSLRDFYKLSTSVLPAPRNKHVQPPRSLPSGVPSRHCLPPMVMPNSQSSGLPSFEHQTGGLFFSNSVERSFTRHIIARFVVDIQGQVYISTPKRNSGPFICHRPPPAPSPRQPLVYWVSGDWPVLSVLGKWTERLWALCAWFLSLGLRFSGFAQVVACVRTHCLCTLYK